MKIKTTILALTACLALIISLDSTANAQRKGKGDKLKAFLNEGFEKTIEEDPQISEAGGINLLSNIKQTTELPADLFNRASEGGDFAVGLSLYGDETPIEASTEKLDEADKKLFDSEGKGGGNNFAGIITYKPGKLDKERSYITIPFMSDKKPIKMTKGMMYCVEYSISLAESSKYATNNIGLLFSKEVLNDAPVGHVAKEAGRTLTNYNNKVYNNFYGWDKVCATYEAKGDEQCLIIGNFEMNTDTKTEVMKKPKTFENPVIPQAYYFIDNIRIKEVTTKEQCKCYQADTANIEDSYSALIYDKTPEINDKMTNAQKIAAHVAYYGFGKKSMTPSSKDIFNYIIQQMNANPDLNIEIEGHNDVKEDQVAEQNQEFQNMARQRAEAVKKYLVGQGIAEDRLTVSSTGAKVNSSEIDNEYDDEETKEAKNRRVMFKVVTN